MGGESDELGPLAGANLDALLARICAKAGLDARGARLIKFHLPRGLQAEQRLLPGIEQLITVDGQVATLWHAAPDNADRSTAANLARILRRLRELQLVLSLSLRPLWPACAVISLPA
jgi:hypothetical protein